LNRLLLRATLSLATEAQPMGHNQREEK